MFTLQNLRAIGKILEFVFSSFYLLLVSISVPVSNHWKKGGKEAEIITLNFVLNQYVLIYLLNQYTRIFQVF